MFDEIIDWLEREIERMNVSASDSDSERHKDSVRERIAFAKKALNFIRTRKQARFVVGYARHALLCQWFRLEDAAQISLILSGGTDKSFALLFREIHKMKEMINSERCNIERRK